MTHAKTVDCSGGLLIGHDGSEFSNAALSWTLDLADRLGTSVTVVRAWVLTTAPRPKTWSPGYMPPLVDFEEASRDRLQADVADLVSEHPDVEVSHQAVHGRPASILVEGSERADMLVVGPRGLGGFRGLVLGSVSEQCVRHAKCPVVVVHGRGEQETPPARLSLDDNLTPDD
ncbi:universal stress protein [Solicola gregarius]|uniref:Universal stress protein n=1 Tax=Solicola gregarius TaxID=2908642 RepID=A0AA46TGW0_9ACTN|nr:universal stress protein [Solicola gregarius]UYM04577.1 universal stress protein [Solicola gregarius]